MHRKLGKWEMSYSQKRKIVVLQSEVAALFKLNAVPAANNLRVMVGIPALSTAGFIPSPAKDDLGNPCGIIRLIEENGNFFAVFRNPKDSVNDASSYQRFPLDGTGVLIFPVKTQEIGNELLAYLSKDESIKNLAAGTGTLCELDQILKDAHDFYIAQGMIPDIYNTNIQYQSEKMAVVFAAAQNSLAGIYTKKSNPVGLIVLKAADPRQIIEFKSSGHFVQDAAQYGTGSIVLISEGSEIRKMAPDYACEHYCFLDKEPLHLDKLPTFDPGNLKPVLQMGGSKTVSEKRVKL